MFKQALTPTKLSHTQQIRHAVMVVGQAFDQHHCWRLKWADLSCTEGSGWIGAQCVHVYLHYLIISLIAYCFCDSRGLCYVSGHRTGSSAVYLDHIKTCLRAVPPLSTGPDAPVEPSSLSLVPLIPTNWPFRWVIFPLSGLRSIVKGLETSHMTLNQIKAQLNQGESII